MKPVIGIVARVEYPGNTHKLVINEEYRNAIIKSGGNPFCILPSQSIDYTDVKFNDQNELTDEEKEMIIEQIKMCNGILMPGGFKTNKFDRFIVEYAIEKDIPILGICLGMQIMANYKKELYWNEKNNSFIDHILEDGTYHMVTLDKNSFLYSIVKCERFNVLSRHHYHALPNDYFDVSSVSDDNYIESIEMKNKKFVVGVQWHPETLEDEYSRNIFNKFIDVCR